VRGASSASQNGRRLLDKRKTEASLSPQNQSTENDVIFKYGSANFIKVFCEALKLILDERKRVDERHRRLFKILEGDLRFFKKKVKEDSKDDIDLLVEKSEKILAVLINQKNF